jgi:transposase-like protein
MAIRRVGDRGTRNRSTTRTVLTEARTVDLDTPRDPAGSFEPLIVCKGSGELDDDIANPLIRIH